MFYYYSVFLTFDRIVMSNTMFCCNRYIRLERTCLREINLNMFVISLFTSLVTIVFPSFMYCKLSLKNYIYILFFKVFLFRSMIFTLHEVLLKVFNINIFYYCFYLKDNLKHLVFLKF